MVIGEPPLSCKPNKKPALEFAGYPKKSVCAILEGWLSNVKAHCEALKVFVKTLSALFALELMDGKIVGSHIRLFKPVSALNSIATESSSGVLSIYNLSLPTVGVKGGAPPMAFSIATFNVMSSFSSTVLPGAPEPSNKRAA